jgi:hypothetical protein
VDDKLQKIAQWQQSYFKSIFDLKQEITTMKLPPNATVFTADVVSLYIHTKTALRIITSNLLKNEDLTSEASTWTSYLLWH